MFDYCWRIFDSSKKNGSVWVMRSGTQVVRIASKRNSLHMDRHGNWLYKLSLIFPIEVEWRVVIEWETELGSGGGREIIRAQGTLQAHREVKKQGRNAGDDKMECFICRVAGWHLTQSCQHGCQLAPWTTTSSARAHVTISSCCHGYMVTGTWLSGVLLWLLGDWNSP